MIEKKKVDLNQVIMYLVSALLILNAPGAIYRYLQPAVVSSQVAKMLLMSVCLFYLLMHRRYLTKSIKTVLLIGAYLLVYIIGSRYGVRSYISSFLLPCIIYTLFACELLKHDHGYLLLKTFSNIVIFIGIISVIFWSFGSILGIMPGRTETTYYWANAYRTAYSYFGMYFDNSYQALRSSIIEFRIIRNTGIFCEAPGYSVVLTYALGIELFAYGKDINKKRVAILLITLLTTLSAKAYLIIIAALGIRYLFYMKSRARVYQVIKMFGVLIISIVTIVALTVLLQDKLSVNSGSIRLDDLTAGLQTWIKNPIFGAGFNNNGAVLDNTEVSRANNGLSMGLTTFLAFGGIYLLLYYIGSLVCAFRSSYLQYHRKELIFFVVLVMIDFFISNVGFSHLFMMMVGLGYATACQTDHKEMRIDRSEKIV